MPNFNVTKTYDTGLTPKEKDLDNIRLAYQTFFNSTKADNDNISMGVIVSNLTSTQVENLLDKFNYAAEYDAEGVSEEQIGSSYENICEITLTDPGYYLISVNGPAYLKDSVSSSATISADSYFRLYDGVSQIGKERRFEITLTYTASISSISFGLLIPLDMREVYQVDATTTIYLQGKSTGGDVYTPYNGVKLSAWKIKE